MRSDNFSFPSLKAAFISFTKMLIELYSVKKTA